MTRKKQRRAWLTLAWMFLIALFGAGCQPAMTYQEMSDAYAVAVDPKEKAQLEKRIERFERDAEKAHEFYRNKAACQHSDIGVWYCDNPITTRRRETELDLDALVRKYRWERTSCGCVKREDLIGRL